jgi:hypothetical protein
MQVTSTREDAVNFLTFAQRGSAPESSVGDDPSGLRTVEKLETIYSLPAHDPFFLLFPSLIPFRYPMV